MYKIPLTRVQVFILEYVLSLNPTTRTGPVQRINGFVPICWAKSPRRTISPTSNSTGRAPVFLLCEFTVASRFFEAEVTHSQCMFSNSSCISRTFGIFLAQVEPIDAGYGSSFSTSAENGLSYGSPVNDVSRNSCYSLVVGVLLIAP